MNSPSQEGFQKDGMTNSGSKLGFGGRGWGFGISTVFGGEDAGFQESEDLDWFRGDAVFHVAVEEGSGRSQPSSPTGISNKPRADVVCCSFN